MKKCLRNEMLYFINSKSLFIVCIFTIFFFTGVVFLNCKQAQDSWHTYRLSTKVMSEEEVKNALNEPNHVEKDEDTQTETVDNPISYYSQILSQQLYVISPKYCVQQALEYGLFIFTILFGILGAYMAVYDRRFHISKMKLSRFSKNQVFFSQQVLMISLILFVLALCVLSTIIAAEVIPQATLKGINRDEFVFKEKLSNSYFLQFGYTILYCFLFCQIGYFFGLLFKNIVCPILIIITYTTFLPVLGTYDLKNIMREGAKRIFHFVGSYRLSDGVSCETGAIVLFLVISIIITFGASCYLRKKQSAYQ